MDQDSRWYTCRLDLRTELHYSQAYYHQSYTLLGTGILDSADSCTSHILLRTLHISFLDNRPDMTRWAQGPLVVVVQILEEEVLWE